MTSLISPILVSARAFAIRRRVRPRLKDSSRAGKSQEGGEYFTWPE
jgi:hypothetical protein